MTIDEAIKYLRNPLSWAIGKTLEKQIADNKEATQMAIDALEKQRWIPCSERLPKESRKYLVTVFDGIGKRTTSAPYHRRSKSWTLTGRMAYWKVIAWMPLPEIYQEGGE